MKRLMGLILASTLLCTTGVYALTDSTSSNYQINVSRGVVLKSEIKQEDGKDPNYHLSLSYPQLSGDDLDVKVQHFNEAIHQYVSTEITEFENKVADNTTEAAKLPAGVNKNSFTLTFSAGSFIAGVNTLVSVRFTKEYFYAGNAHPSHDIEVYNYNLTGGKRVKLDSLFKPHADYLKVIADFCKAQLIKRYKNQKTSWTANGLAPTTENFDNWNVEPDGLLITFDEYQVASYVEGQPEVFVPYKTLQSVIAPDAVIAPCLKDPRSCRAVVGVTGDV
jgi:hypothetical protein